MSSAAEALMSLALNESRYLSLLGRLIGVAAQLQNNPAQGLVPQEDKVTQRPGSLRVTFAS